MLGLNDHGQMRLIVESGEIAIALANIKSAKLVLTDALIAAAVKEQEQ